MTHRPIPCSEGRVPRRERDRRDGKRIEGKGWGEKGRSGKGRKGEERQKGGGKRIRMANGKGGKGKEGTNPPAAVFVISFYYI